MATNSLPSDDLAEDSDASGDEGIAVLKEEANDTSMVMLNSTDSAADRFHITTGKIVDPGSVHVLQGVVLTLQQRIKEITSDNSRLKANFRRTMRTRPSADSSLPATLNSLEHVSSVSRDTGLGSSLQDFRDDSSQKHSTSVKDNDLRVMEGELKAQQKEVYKVTIAKNKVEKQLKELQIKVDELFNENKLLNAHFQENEGKRINLTSVLQVKSTEIENLKKRNSALEDENEKILKEKAVFEKQVKMKQKELFNLNKDFSDYKQQVEAKLDSSQVQSNEKASSSPKQTSLTTLDTNSLLVRALNELQKAEKDVKLVHEQCNEQMNVINKLVEREKKRASKRELKLKTKNLSDIQESVAYPVTNATEGASNVSIPYSSRSLPTEFRTEKQKQENFSSSNKKHVQSKLSDSSSDRRVPDMLTIHQEADLHFSRNIYSESNNFKKSAARVALNVFDDDDQDLYGATELTEFEKHNSDQFPGDDTCVIIEKDGVIIKSDPKNDHIRLQPDGATAPLSNYNEFRINRDAADYSPPRLMVDNSPTKQPVQESGGSPQNLSGSPRICPTCHRRFSTSMSMTDFQNHILDCSPDAVEYRTEYHSMEERVCPVCNAIYPASVPQVEFEQHVMYHFANDPSEYEIVN